MVDTAFYEKNGPFTLAQVAKICDAKLLDESQAQVVVQNIATMNHASENDICFFYDKKNKEKGAEIKAKACVTTEMLAPFVAQGVIILVSANPKLSQGVKILSICCGAVIGEKVVIGENCVIEPNVVIGRACKIGNNTKIGANASISYAIIGDNCYIYAGVRIGQDGFGFMMIDGKHVRIPQLGRVIIGNDVEVGANTCIDRGALDDTVIGDGCKIDNLVQIAHNDKFGNNCIVVSQTGVAGSCTFGDYVVCGGQTGFADHLNIGSGAQIASQSGIMRDIAPGEVMMGYPAVKFKDFMRQVACLQKLSNKHNS